MNMVLLNHGVLTCGGLLEWKLFSVLFNFLFDLLFHLLFNFLLNFFLPLKNSLAHLHLLLCIRECCPNIRNKNNCVVDGPTFTAILGLRRKRILQEKKIDTTSVNLIHFLQRLRSRPHCSLVCLTAAFTRAKSLVGSAPSFGDHSPPYGTRLFFSSCANKNLIVCILCFLSSDLTGVRIITRAV